MESEEKKFDFVDLFAGLGGFHVALKKIGGRGVFAAEWVESLRALYMKNHHLLPAGDLTKIDGGSIPDHDLLAAGFPCQPFSKAGEQLGFEHTDQGQLFFKVAEILSDKQPSHFILENVPNLLKHDGGRTLETMLTILRGVGYEVDHRKFSPHNFGIPQVRDRVYIIGSLDGLDHFEWPAATHENTSVTTILDADPSGARELSQATIYCLETWNGFLASSPQDLQMPSFPIWAMEFGADYPYEAQTPQSIIGHGGNLSQYRGSFGLQLEGLTPDEQLAALPSHARRAGDTFPKWKKDFIRQNRDFYANNREWIDPWLPRIKNFPSSQQKFEWNAKGEEKDLWNLIIQFRASGVRVKRATTAPSLIAMTDTQVPIIGWQRRYMTPRECSRLQSLDGIVLPDSRPAAYRALGNAVNAEVVRKIAEPLLRNGHRRRTEPNGARAAGVAA